MMRDISDDRKCLLPSVPSLRYSLTDTILKENIPKIRIGKTIIGIVRTKIGIVFSKCRGTIPQIPAGGSLMA